MTTNLEDIEVIPKEDRRIIKKTAVVCGIEVTVNGLKDVNINEVKNYLEFIEKNLPKSDRLTKLTISKEKDGNIALDYTAQPPKMERIRRITGYLTGSVDRWNNAKRAEEHDRVKHTTGR